MTLGDGHGKVAFDDRGTVYLPDEDSLRANNFGGSKHIGWLTMSVNLASCDQRIAQVKTEVSRDDPA